MFDKNPVSELSVAVIDACWGASGVSFAGYALQNSVRAFTASRFGLPRESEPGNDPPNEPDELLRKIYGKEEQNGTP